MIAIKCICIDLCISNTFNAFHLDREAIYLLNNVNGYSTVAMKEENSRYPSPSPCLYFIRDVVYRSGNTIEI